MTSREDVLIIAHRGASADYPENTREAFIGAAEQQADWVELDVRITLDGGLIVNHDAWYHDQRRVWETPVATRPPDVPDLEQALDACAFGEMQMGVNVEIKNIPADLGGDDVPHTMDVVDAVLQVLETRRGRGIEEEILITSFDPASLARVRAMNGPPTGQLLFDLARWPDVIAQSAEAGHAAVNPWDPTVDDAFVGDAHAAGLAVNVWTVDEFARIRDLADMGVDGIITNVPASARKALRA